MSSFSRYVLRGALEGFGKRVVADPGHRQLLLIELLIT